MMVAAHQPAYLPWLGYLAKIAAADLFVVMDDLQYEAQNFQNRNRIKTGTGADRHHGHPWFVDQGVELVKIAGVGVTHEGQVGLLRVRLGTVMQGVFFR